MGVNGIQHKRTEEVAAPYWTFIVILFVALSNSSPLASQERSEGVRIKDLGRISTVRDNMLVGYGLVTGLAGTGDSARSLATSQSINNLLLRLGVYVESNQIRSRNVAAVMVMATLPPFVQPGDHIDLNVTSIGDARSLVGGTLVLMHLTGPDGKIYALGQGAVSVGGFSYDMFGNLIQKNHPTAGIIPGGGVVERSSAESLVNEHGGFDYVLSGPDFTTAHRISGAIQSHFGQNAAHAVDAGRVRVTVPATFRDNIVGFMTAMEGLTITPDQRARVVINERTGTVVSGGDVRLSQVSITHGEIRVSISTEYIVSQPLVIGGSEADVQTSVVPRTNIDVSEKEPLSIAMPSESTVNDLVLSLNRVSASSRDIITILQAIKQAGGLYAELIIQ